LKAFDKTFAFRVWLKVEVVLPFVIVYGCAAESSMDLAVYSALALYFVNSHLDFLEWPNLFRSLMLSIEITFSALILPVLVILLHSKNEFRGVFREYGYISTLCSVAGVVLVGRITSIFIDRIFGAAQETRKKRLSLENS
jgi:hypothetical protein